MTSDSDLHTRWSVLDAEAAVKAAFIVEGRHLRYTQVRESIQRRGRTISDRTLSKALKSLSQRGFLDKKRSEQDRRGVVYSLRIRPHEEMVSAFVAAQVALLESIAQDVGIVGDQTENWAFYGVPKVLKPRLRPRLRREAQRIQARVDAILMSEKEKFIRSFLSRAQGRVSVDVLRSAERALRQMLAGMRELGHQTMALATTVTLTERIAPGGLAMAFKGKLAELSTSLQRFRRELGDSDDKELARKIGALYAERMGVSQSLFVRTFKDAQALSVAVDSLSKRDRRWADAYMMAWVGTLGSIVAVVR